jgi:hypothetical protein
MTGVDCRRGDWVRWVSFVSTLGFRSVVVATTCRSLFGAPVVSGRPLRTRALPFPWDQDGAEKLHAELLDEATTVIHLFARGAAHSDHQDCCIGENRETVDIGSR